MNHTPDTVVSNPQYTAYLKWISGMSGQDAKDKSVGPAIALKVEPGDQMDIEAWVKYRKKTSYTRSGITAAMASILGSSYTGTASGLDVLANATQTFQNGLVAATGAHGNGNDAGSLPYAYVYYLLYDRSFNFITAGWKRVTTEGGFDTSNESLASHGHLSIPGLTFTEPGYIYIFVSNESENTEVWFDDLHVDHKRSTIVAGADYYPFGLPMENRKITREDYRYGYQGQYSEEEKETGWNSFELRMYDARIGRWLTVDPYGQFASPYVAMGNNPAMNIDPDGGSTGPIIKAIGAFKYANAIEAIGDEAIAFSLMRSGVPVLRSVTVTPSAWGSFLEDAAWIANDFGDFMTSKRVLNEMGRHFNGMTTKVASINLGYTGIDTGWKGDYDEFGVKLGFGLDVVQSIYTMGIGPRQTPFNQSGVLVTQIQNIPMAIPVVLPTIKATDEFGLLNANQKPRSYEEPIGKRIKFPSRKKAYEAAKRAGKGEPVLHGEGQHGPHYHPGDGKGKPLNHDHYYFPDKQY